MNAVNRPLAVATAHKLRSAAAAILADAANQVDARLADSLMYEAGEIKARADSIEEQAKPAVEEPTEFGSLVRARSCGPLSMLWQRSLVNGKHYWESDTGAVEVWSALTDVEVLRVGIGTPAEPVVFSRGYEAAQTAIRSMLRTLRSEAITSERKSAYDRALEAVEEMQP